MARYEDSNMDETIMLEAYRLIRIKAREFNGSSDEILGAYTRGVVDLQSELYNDVIIDNRKTETE